MNFHPVDNKYDIQQARALSRLPSSQQDIVNIAQRWMNLRDAGQVFN